MYEEVRVALRTTLAKGFGGNHSLCHGDLGNLDFAFRAVELFDDPDLIVQLGELTTTVIDDILDNGWRCGNPMNVDSPGLMTGISGIGYGLLRLAEPRSVPCVLTLSIPTSAGPPPV